jgi:hypothetical protein
LKARKLYLLLYLRAYYKHKQAKINLYKQACKFQSAEYIINKKNIKHNIYRNNIFEYLSIEITVSIDLFIYFTCFSFLITIFLIVDGILMTETL